MTPSDVLAYYRASLRVLRFLEHRRPTGRRFGVEADARWTALRGDLAVADRIDLLIRDANAEWPGALGARAVFALSDVAEDDPFGPRWVPLDPVDGEELWRAILAEPAPTSLGAALDAVAAAWELKLSPFSVGPVTPTDRLLVAGPSAIAGTVAAAAEGALDWHRQVVAAATSPAARHLAALAPAWLNVNTAIHVLAVDEAAPGLGVRRAVVSHDASADDRRWVGELAARKG